MNCSLVVPFVPCRQYFFALFVLFGMLALPMGMKAQHIIMFQPTMVGYQSPPITISTLTQQNETITYSTTDPVQFPWTSPCSGVSEPAGTFCPVTMTCDPTSVGPQIAYLNIVVTFPNGSTTSSSDELYCNGLPPSSCDTSGNICTIAGNGNGTYSGDGGLATAESLYNPLGLYIDGSNDVFVADAYNNRVREFTVGGTISTIAGNGQGGIGVGDAGDGGPATSAITNTPGAVTEDGAGNLDILDMFSNGISFPVPDADTYSDIRVVSLTTNQISNLLGNACNAGSCNGTNPYTFGTYANDFALGQYTDPNSGNTYSAYYLPFYASSDMSVLDADGSQFWYDISPGNPVAVAVDNTNNVEYFSNAPLSFDGGPFAQTYQYQVMMIDVNGNVTPIAGVGPSCTTYDQTQDGGPATSACMTPGALAVDAQGDVFIADPVANVVRVVVSPLNTTLANRGDIYTVAGDAALGAGYNGDGIAATSAQLNSPSGLKVDSSGNLYISDTQNNRVRRVINPPFPRLAGGLPDPGCTPAPRHPCPGGE
jgi:hypothetical protein